MKRPRLGAHSWARIGSSRLGLGLLALCLATACASVPAGRYGVRSVRVQGAEQLDEHSILACLGTRARPRFSIDIGTRGDPACGEPPFDGSHFIIDPWSWPWSEWPLYDESILERDIARVERWYRARGFYDARVLSSEVSPTPALASGQSAEACGDGEGQCEVNVSFTVEEGEPVTIQRIAIRGVDDLDEAMRVSLRGVLQLRGGDRMDEALHEATKRRMVRVLADAGYAHARVGGSVKINRGRREAFLIYEIDHGPPSVIGRVCLTGYGELPPQTLLEMVGLSAGARFSLRALEESQRALYALGVLSGVEITPVGPEGAPRPSAEEEAESPTARLIDRPTRGARVCRGGPGQVEPPTETVDIEVRVVPGRLERASFGVGLQAGQALTFGTLSSMADQQNAAQWDIHLSAAYEHRNVFDNLIRARFEVRPRLIFDMPVFNFSPAQDPPLGVLTSATFRWPAFLEARTNLILQLRHDLGPMPFTNFFRSELDGAFGPERTFFDGKLYGGVFIHGNWFLPTDRQPIRPQDQLPEMGALWLEQVIRLDLRDNPAQPTEGIFFGVSSQQSAQAVSSWDFVRVVGEVRGYVPIGDVVLAGRFSMGVMHIFGTSLPDDNIYEFGRLGPPSLRLIGGGASSNRGFLPGLMGDAEQRYVSLPRSDEEIQRGTPIYARPVRLIGGNFLWDASLELRIPLTTSFGVVLFGDAGDVDRNRLDVDDAAPTFRFDHPQITVGFGVRYRTIIGPLRLDIGFRPDELQVFAQDSDLPPPCGPVAADRCRPENRLDFGFFTVPAAFHLTIGESF